MMPAEPVIHLPVFLAALVRLLLRDLVALSLVLLALEFVRLKLLKLQPPDELGRDATGGVDDGLRLAGGCIGGCVTGAGSMTTLQ